MNRRTLLFATFACTLLGQSFAHGQRETERYIPIGQSPGVSGKATRVGTIEAVDAGARSFRLATDEGRYEIAVPPGARIWLDRSRGGQSAQSGEFGDLRIGRRVEVRFAQPARTGPAGWIKVEVAE
ncbi:MAG: hypothetical protein ACREGK_05790 [Geminicoccales bacterium]